ncbi:MAG: TonB-dependent receptor [Saprospiraceae bacterium]|nr:TonB-dependent receptor [Saprospiraceae bacterium]
MKSYIAAGLAGLFLCNLLNAQTDTDTLQTGALHEIKITARRSTISRLQPIQGAYIWAGKKNEVIQMEGLDANVAERTPRQIFAKVPGVFVYDMDGSGNQTNFSTRGLDPHRSWEFNIRANGTITNSDMYGYPASHFNLPMEAIGRIELVRGTGALQYGAQFGGMLNYVIKRPDTTQNFDLESVSSIGSFGLLSTFNAIGGKIGKLEYYAFYNKRVSDGYRDNSTSDFDAQGAVLRYMVSNHFTLRAELLRSNYIYQLPGPLTDAMFQANPRQSTRSRSYYNPEIFVPSLSAAWKIGANSLLSWTASAVLGDRRSVLFDRAANIPDTINHTTFQYNGRQVDNDNFNSYTTELRLRQEYSLFGHRAYLVLGAQYMNNDLHRQQQGKGTTGTDFDMTITSAGWGRDMHLKTKNIAVFAENKFQLTRNLAFSPGIRFESGASRMEGSISYLPPLEVENTIKHRFPLLGANLEYTLSDVQNMYAGWSQAYRPVIFKDIIPGNVYERADKNLKDAYGYNAEIGWRGSFKDLKWDIGVFTMLYNNRLGSITQYSGDLDTLILYRTNIGDSRTNGLEMFLEYGFYIAENLSASLFTSTSFFDAKYLGDSIRYSAKENRSIKGNRVESTPQWISRNGLNLKYKTLSVSLLYSYTAKSYADPLNTETPNATGTVGLVPAYGLLDVNASLKVNKLLFRLSVNNVADKQYFTKRPTFYPGPGIWPSDGRSVVLSVGFKLGSNNDSKASMGNPAGAY